jgi:hypothetical protein
MIVAHKKLNSTHDSFYRKGKGRRIGARLVRARLKAELIKENS